MHRSYLALSAAVVPYFWLIAGCSSDYSTSSQKPEIAPSSWSFCPTELCGPGTQCNEAKRSCEPLPPFCPTALCKPGTECNEQARRCE